MRLIIYELFFLNASSYGVFIKRGIVWIEYVLDYPIRFSKGINLMKKNVLLLGFLVSIGLFSCRQVDNSASTDSVSEDSNTASNVSATTEDSKGLIEASLREYLGNKNLKLEDSPHKVEYIDLNGDNIKDALTVFTGANSCNDSGCTMLVHQGIADNKFKLVSETTSVKSPITISETISNGFRDVVVPVGSDADSKNVALKFDGKAYPENASTQPAIKQNEISGDKLAFDSPINPDKSNADSQKGDKTAKTEISSQCQAAINQGKTKVADVVNIGFNQASENDIGNNYEGIPKQRSTQYQFTVGGRGGTNIMYSPVFMSDISKNIISNCNQIGSVKFEVNQTDNRVAYGLIDDSVKKFECIAPAPGSKTSKLKWGQISCP